MLSIVDKQSFLKHADYFYGLTENKANSAFPLYCDGIKSKEIFLNTAKKSFERKDEMLLIYEKDGEIKGLFQIFFSEENKYVGLQIAVAENDFKDAFEELISSLYADFKGFIFSFYLPEENKETIDFLSGTGRESLSAEEVFTVLFENYVPRKEVRDIAVIDKDNFDGFRKIHKRFEKEMFWTSDKIYRTIGDWKIFADDCGTVFFNVKGIDCEIFGLEMNSYDEDKAKSLLTAALNWAKKECKRSMYYFAGEGFEKPATEAGFKKLTKAYYYEMRIGEKAD